jgi:hypothetical protein
LESNPDPNCPRLRLDHSQGNALKIHRASVYRLLEEADGAFGDGNACRFRLKVGGGAIPESHGQLNTSFCIQQAAADRKKQKHILMLVVIL